MTAPTPRIGPFAAQGFGCPKCGSILNAAAAGCDGEWHAGNQSTPPAPTGPEPEERAALTLERATDNPQWPDMAYGWIHHGDNDLGCECECHKAATEASDG